MAKDETRERMNAPQAYPLQWPAGWPRTEPARREKGAFRCTLAGALSKLEHELDLMGTKGLVLSSNCTLGSARPADPGVCAFFTHDAIQLAIPCDRWLAVEGNVQAIALTVEAMRGMNRWGAKHMIRAMFTGFRALPAPTNGKPWHAVLAVPAHAPTETVLNKYRELAKQRHPDLGGTHDAFTELQTAIDAFKAERGI